MQPASNNHIVQKQYIEINFDQLEDAMGIQHELADVYYEKLQPAMLALFDEMANEKHAITIETLEIDCGRLNNHNWKEEWVTAVIRNLKQQLNAANKREIDQTQIAEEGLLFFLSTGLLSWNNRAISLADMESIPLSAGWIEKLKALLHHETRAVERLVNAFSKDFLNNILRKLMNGHASQSGTGSADSISLLLRVFSAPRMDVIQENLDCLLANKPLNVQVSKPVSLRSKNKIPGLGIFIGNAGLVLLHPFLPVLFEKLGLWQDKQWTDSMAQHRGVLLLAFLATGSEPAAEFNLALNKILCGMAVDEVWKLPEPLSVAEQDECNELLDQVIGNWSKLKNTSRQGLREAFLQRNGKLEMGGERWKLKVEQKAFDILLDSLPWGIGIIKLPWMQDMLYTEWNN